ncbi:MAG: hypothetical protein Q9195_007896 [Heterodermia aff. obscurata]
MNASNTGKRLSASSMGYQTLDDSSENLGKKSPRFMSPTVSSTKQTNSRPSGHVGTPSPLNSSTRARASGNWMSSAAKRVGLNRVHDGTPRSRKEALARQPKAISFPDKFAGPPYASVPNPSISRSATPKFDKATLDAKPLPSPPVAQIVMAGPLKQNRTLIDASEKPLRRSPPGKPQEEEVWPVLYPNRPTTPGTLRQMTPERDGVLATTDNIHQPTERYPRLPSMGTYESNLDMERKASPKAIGQQIQRKQVSSPNLRKTSMGPKSVTSGQEKGRQGATPLNVKKNDQPDSHSLEVKLPASTAAFNNARVDEKPINTRPSSEPRQTRTSSLRARMSAGTATNENMKPNGNKAADATTATEPLATEKDIKRRSTPKPPGAFPVGRKLSRDSLRGKKPAQFVAGSRRPSSRGSLRSDSRASSTTAQPRSEKVSDDTAPSMVASLGQSLDTVNTMEKGPEIAPRRSSIPVFTHTISNVETHADRIGESKSIDAINAPASAEESTIFEDNIESHLIGSLDAIEESPHQGYHVRRLSLISPEHGPTLKISPSADRIIMGTGSDKENDEPKKSRNKTRVPASRDGSFSKDKPAHLTKTKYPKQTRPLSSLGLLQSTSRRGTVDSEARSKKVKSAEITPSPSLTYSSALNSRTPNTSRKTTDTSNEDPFFDAQSSIDKRISRLDHQTTSANAIAVGEPAWVAPVHNHLNLTADSDAVLNPSDVQSMLTHEENHTDSVTADILSMMYKEDEIQESNLEATQPQASTDNAPIELPADDTLVNSASVRLTEATPITPEHSTTAAGSSSFDSLPPRSSSRTTHPDFISNKHSPTSPLGNKEAVSKEFTDRQNRLGSLGGHATAQVDSAYPASNRKSARNSVACESNVSQGSISKGVFSNIKGLFHKRSSDEPVKSGKKHKQQKASTASNGSPFPPISEVHPAHRPTLSSARHTNTHGLTPKASMPSLGTNVMLSPPLNSPAPSELATTTTMAMQILESARKERSSPKKERLLELGKILVDALTQARDAEKALEEAKQAARKAEVSYELCKRSVSQVKKVVEQWREELKGNASR